MIPFDYETFADIINGKEITGENLSRFVRSARTYYENEKHLRTTIQDLRCVIEAREAEIKLLKNNLKD